MLSIDSPWLFRSFFTHYKVFPCNQIPQGGKFDSYPNTRSHQHAQQTTQLSFNNNALPGIKSNASSLFTTIRARRISIAIFLSSREFFAKLAKLRQSIASASAHPFWTGESFSKPWLTGGGSFYRCDAIFHTRVEGRVEFHSLFFASGWQVNLPEALGGEIVHLAVVGYWCREPERPPRP